MTLIQITLATVNEQLDNEELQHEKLSHDLFVLSSAYNSEDEH